MSKKVFSVALLLLPIISALCGCAPDYYTELPPFKYYTQCQKEVFATGITFRAAVRGGSKEHERAALEEMTALLDDINSDMSLTLSGSALATFNALGSGSEQTGDSGYQNEYVEISRSTYELIQKAVEYYKDTDGAFNIAVYPLSVLWNVDSEGLRKYGLFGSEDAPPPPSYEKVSELRSACDLNNLLLDCTDGVYRIAKTDPRLQIDLGAVAKGYAADRCVEIAKAHGIESALINISGNICLLGDWYHPTQKKYVRWEVGVLAPRPRNSMGGNVCALSVPAGKTLVSSGDYERYYQTQSGGEPLFVPHIVSSQTGMPLGIRYNGTQYANSDNHIMSATVICNDSAKADAYATAVCLMEYEKAVEFLQSRGLHAILLTADGRMALVGVTERDSSGEEYFIRKDTFGGYKSYTVEEFPAV